MSGVHDNIKATESVTARLSTPPPPEAMPAVQLCPSQHRTERVVLDLIAKVERDGMLRAEECRVAMYWCSACQVVYRAGEVTLPPGEEGHP